MCDDRNYWKFHSFFLADLFLQSYPIILDLILFYKPHIIFITRLLFYPITFETNVFKTFYYKTFCILLWVLLKAISARRQHQKLNRYLLLFKDKETYFTKNYSITGITEQQCIAMLHCTIQPGRRKLNIKSKVMRQPSGTVLCVIQLSVILFYFEGLRL